MEVISITKLCEPERNSKPIHHCVEKTLLRWVCQSWIQRAEGVWCTSPSVDEGKLELVRTEQPRRKSMLSKVKGRHSKSQKGTSRDLVLSKVVEI